MEILHINPLVRFKITGKYDTTRLLEGSEGFISFVNPSSSYLASAHAIITRKGKTGKPRIEKYDINFPVIFNPELSLHDFYPSCSHMEFESTRGNILDMDNLDFLGWASAYRYLLGHLSKNSTIQYNIWSKDNDNPIRALYRHFGDNMEHKLTLVSDKEFRKSFIQEMNSVANILNKDMAFYIERMRHKHVADAFTSLKRSYRDQFNSNSVFHTQLKDFEKTWLDNNKK